VKALGPLGYRVILAEYPRYGGRKGELGEKAFVNDGSETVRLAFTKYGEPLFLLGESLGCGIAAAIARETSVKIGIILITPWDTFASVAQSAFPLLPVRHFLKDKYDNIENLRSFKGRIAVVGAERDEIVPIIHAKKLYDSLPGTAKRMWIIQGAGHNDWPMVNVVVKR
jgi:pimeloyl-ACP methyl ester carboxylesterase